MQVSELPSNYFLFPINSNYCNCRISYIGDALRVGGVRGYQADEFVSITQVWRGLVVDREIEGPKQKK